MLSLDERSALYGVSQQHRINGVVFLGHVMADPLVRHVDRHRRSQGGKAQCVLSWGWHARQATGARLSLVAQARNRSKAYLMAADCSDRSADSWSGGTHVPWTEELAGADGSGAKLRTVGRRRHWLTRVRSRGGATVAAWAAAILLPHMGIKTTKRCTASRYCPLALGTCQPAFISRYQPSQGESTTRWLRVSQAPRSFCALRVPTAWNRQVPKPEARASIRISVPTASPDEAGTAVDAAQYGGAEAIENGLKVG